MKNIAIVLVFLSFFACNQAENVDLTKLEKTVWFLQTTPEAADSIVFGPENLAAYFIADHQVYNPLTYSVSGDTVIMYVSGGMQGGSHNTGDTTVVEAPKPRAIWKFIQENAELNLVSLEHLNDSTYTSADAESMKNKVYKLKK